jgi:hypothetical protein
METITVIPLEWKNTGRYSYLAGDLTRILTNGVKRANAYNFIDPVILKNVEKSNYWEYVDVYIDCEIIDVKTDDKTEIKEEKDGDKTKTVKYITRTVTVDIEYRYISAIDERVLGYFDKTAKESETFNYSTRASKWWQELLLDIFIPQGPSTEKLSRSAIQQFSYMYNELNPYTTTEERKIIRSKSKEQVFKEAGKLVRQKKYLEALLLYKNIYEETGNITAGYNMALLLQANNQFLDALALLEELDEKLYNMGINSPPFIIREIEKIKLIINELRILEEYKN